MIKKILFFVYALIVASCVQKPEGSFTIKGTINSSIDLNGREVYFYYAKDLVDYSAVLDTTVIEDGKFSFSGIIADNFSRGTISLSNPTDYENSNRFDIYFERGEQNAIIDGTDFSKSVIEECAIWQQAKEYNDIVKPFESRLLSLREQGMMDEFEAILDTMYQEINNFIRTHPDSYISAERLSFNSSQMEYEEIKTLYDGLSERVKLSSPAKSIKKELISIENTQPGKMAPNFTTEDINGESFTLSDLQGNLVLLDFWASWCKPCRASNPHLLEVYSKYHEKGLEIVCVGDNDASPEEWKKAIEADGIGAFRHVLRGLKTIEDEKGNISFDRTNDIDNLYAIHFIPTKFLIDREGKIVCKIESEEQLNEELARLL